MSLVNPVGTAIGPALGGFLQAWAGYGPLFLMSAGIGLVGLICAFQVKPASTQTKQSVPKRSVDQPFWRMLVSPRLRVPTFVMLMIGLAFGTLATFLPLFIQETRIDFNAGLFYTAGAISSFGVRFLTGRASDRIGRGPFITIGLGLYAAAMLATWMAHEPAYFLIAGVMEGTGAGILLPMVIALIADRSRPDERGRVLGCAWPDLIWEWRSSVQFWAFLPIRSVIGGYLR